MKIYVCDTRAFAREKLSEALSALPPARRAAALACKHEDARLDKVLGFWLVQHVAKQTFPDLPIADWQLEKGGKPHLSKDALHFSLSHSANCLALAVSPDQPIGLDVQKITPHPTGFAARWLSAAECTALQNAPDKEEALARIWTAKEAVAKRTGAGLAQNVAAIDTRDTSGTVFSLGDARYALSLCPAAEEIVLVFIDPNECTP